MTRDVWLWVGLSIAVFCSGYLFGMMERRPSWLRRLWWDLYDRYRILRQRSEAWRRRSR